MSKNCVRCETRYVREMISCERLTFVGVMPEPNKCSSSILKETNGNEARPPLKSIAKVRIFTGGAGFWHFLSVKSSKFS